MKAIQPSHLSERQTPRLPGRGVTLVGLLTLLLCACGSGSGGGSKSGSSKLPGGGGGGGGGTNQGSYELSDFHYKETLPKSYQPFGKDIYELQRDELAVFVDNYGAKTDGLIIDDDEARHRLLPPIASAFPKGAEVFDAAGGQLDADAPREAVAAALYPTKIVNRRQHFDVKIRIYGTDARGNATQDLQFSAGVDAVNATLRLADIDGDGRDEIILACATGTRSSTGNKYSQAGGATLRVFDDEVGKHALLFKIDSLPYSGKIYEFDGRVAAGDLDGDGKAEIVFMERVNSKLVQARVFDDASQSFKQVHTWSNKDSGKFAPFPSQNSQAFVDWIDIDVVTGDFDGDDSDEIIFVGIDSYGSPQMELALYDGMDAKAPFALLDRPKNNGWRHVRYTPFTKDRSWQVMAADLDGNGTDSLLLHTGNADGSSAPGMYEVSVTQWAFGEDRTRWLNSERSLEIANQRNFMAGSRMTVIHDVFEKKDRLAVAIVNHDSLGGTKLEMHRVGKKDIGTGGSVRYDLTIEKSWTQPLQPSAKKIHTPILAAADLQGDGLTVQYTGKKVLTLADPSPICLMAAPPTKADVSQNYDDTEVSYGRSTTKTVTHTTSATTTVTGEAGLSADFRNAFFSFDVRATYESSIEKAHGSSKTITRTTNFVGGHEADYIVFEGIVYRSYIYKILASRDTRLIGTKISIDVPVQSRIYKWTLAYYNKTVEAKARLDRQKIFQHKIGDPISYPTEEKAKGLVGTGRGWLSSPQTVGQGTRINESTVDVEKTNSTEKSRTIASGLQGELQVGPFVAGASYGVGNTSVFSIEVGIGSHFSGAVGDIEDTQDFSDWNYAFGLAVYQQRGGQGLAHGFQVLNFWVDPTGTQY